MAAKARNPNRTKHALSLGGVPEPGVAGVGTLGEKRQLEIVHGTHDRVPRAYKYIARALQPIRRVGREGVILQVILQGEG